jgi:hypothetical protein
MEPGDHFDSGPQWVRDRVYLIVDDQVIKTYHKLVETDSTGGEGISSDTGEVIWKAPDGDPFNVCYKVVLGVGLHTATIVIEKTSGEQETFTWQFRITE